MHILIADDVKDVVDAFASTIHRLGHVAITCNSLSQARSAVNDLSRPIDIAFLDNHFKGEGFGIDHIRAFRASRPEMDIVITTKYAVKPEMLIQILEMQVGFCSKEVVDPVRLELEVAQRVNAKLNAERLASQRLQEVREMATKGREGFFRVFNLFEKRRKKCEVRLESIQKTRETAIVPGFKLFQTVHVGHSVEIQEEFQYSVTSEIKAATELQLGLGMEESSQFFASRIGKSVRAELATQFSLGEMANLVSGYKRGQKLSLTESDQARGIRRREYYRGIIHTIFRAKFKSECNHCGSSMPVWVRIFVPSEIIEVTVGYDKMGMRIPEEDGRLGYRVVE